MTFVSDQVTLRPLQPMLSTGSEHQGQDGISDPDQNLGFTCIFFIRYARIMVLAFYLLPHNQDIFVIQPMDALHAIWALIGIFSGLEIFEKNMCVAQ